MWRNSISLIFLTSLTYCSTAPDKGVTFKNVSAVATASKLIRINELNSLKEYLPKENELDHVKLMGNITKLYKDSISDIDNLITLILEDNQLYEIEPSAFGNLPKLRELSIRWNKLNEIKKGIFNDLPIEELDLGFNKIEIIEDGAFGDMPKLRRIYLHGNKIKSWNQKWFVNSPNLRTIYLNRNEIQELSDDAFNNITNPHHFMSLLFSDNQIKKINKNTFRNLKDITYIDLEGNQIDNLEENWSEGTTIYTLDINNNRFTCLQGDFDKIFTARSTNINGNPWDCGCLKKILEYAKSHKKVIEMDEARDKCGL